MTHNGRWMWMTLVATLVIGVGVGILFDRVVLERAVHSDNVERAESDRSDHDSRRQRFREHLREELDLTSEQAERLEAVLGRNHETAHEFWEASRREFDELRQQFRHDIREVLTEEQKARFDQLLAERDAARRRGN